MAEIAGRRSRPPAGRLAFAAALLHGDRVQHCNRRGRRRCAGAVAGLLLVGALTVGGCRTPAVDGKQARAELQALCARLAARCQTCGKPHAPAAAPAPPAQSPLPARLLDAWGNSVRIAVAGDALTLQSAGPDGALDTPDDVSERCAQP